jgi:hypothetical protein
MDFVKLSDGEKWADGFYYAANASASLACQLLKLSFDLLQTPTPSFDVYN